MSQQVVHFSTSEAMSLINSAVSGKVNILLLVLFY